MLNNKVIKGQSETEKKIEKNKFTHIGMLKKIYQVRKFNGRKQNCEQWIEKKVPSA